MNLWHDIPLGDDRPDVFNTIIEIPRGSKNKYEIDKDTGLIKLDRVAHTAQDFPFDYGFAPRTYWEDDDPLDVILLTTFPLLSGILLSARPVAFMRMTDDGDNDDKIVAVPKEDPRWSEIKDKDDIASHTLKEMEHFYSTYKKIQGKEVSVSGFEGADAAKEAIRTAEKKYQDTFGAQQ